ncbi:ABC-three component system middle component 6 [Candidatus Poriferisodalis sp.]|uniref:ABC-three component system middle component 6 n=1 Tax=Candidatus Poriferisodalis sp. TaxID=3101277 RepID=UPI003B01F128
MRHFREPRGDRPLIVPTKGIHPDRAMITIGSEIIDILQEPMTVSALWSNLQERRAVGSTREVGFDWFILTLDLLYALGAITLDSYNFLSRRSR